MDEPTSALDPISTAKIEELIFKLKEQYTIVIVTHNMQQAGRISDQTAFFYMGELIETRQNTKLYHRKIRLIPTQHDTFRSRNKKTKKQYVENVA